jgi:hypothetical protein
VSSHLSPTPTFLLADLWRALTHPYTPKHKKESSR